MQLINTLPIKEMGKNFIPKEFLPKGKDDYYLRELQRDKSISYRPLKADEIEILIKNKNKTVDWNNIFVTDGFDPERVHNCTFHGLVRIGDLDPLFLEHKDLQLPVGLYDSLILSCEIGSNVVIRNVAYLANYIIGNHVILINIDEMLTTHYAKFGNGILKENEDSDHLISLELGNENGNRKVRPFNGMLSADCYLWYKYRDDQPLLDKLIEMTNKKFDHRRGYYGTIKERTVIKNCHVIKDVKTGSDAYLKGANKLKNLTINSSPEAHTQIGEGVELVNGIVGYGCQIFYGVKAVRFVLADHSQLKYGARLINSFLGENSTISCCEVLNSLIFPCHEQHHNNSFLCATTIKGQSNIAAGATVGSNHNSRAADGEIVAGRGFWPGLCSNFKHFSKFASFCLVAKGTYHAELNIELPFALISNNEMKNQLQIMAGYWFLYNMYAMARNPDKYRSRDKRLRKNLLLEFDYLAPDTIEEILIAEEKIKQWTGESFLSLSENKKREIESKIDDKSLNLKEKNVLKLGKALLSDAKATSLFTVYASGQEASKRQVILLKPTAGFQAYQQMVAYFITQTLIQFADSHGKSALMKKVTQIKASDKDSWINMGGQLIPSHRVDHIRHSIREGKISQWDQLHEQWKNCAAKNQTDKVIYAISLLKGRALSFKETIQKGISTSQIIAKRTQESRAKDYSNPFRMLTFDNAQERDAVLGKLEDNSFIEAVKKQSLIIKEKGEALLSD